MGAFVPGRSDVDFVAIVDGDLDRAELARLRALHLGRWASSLIRDVGLRRRWPFVCNGIYLRSGDLATSPLTVTPLAGYVSGRFGIARSRGFDVNPVTWHVLARHGIAVRGPEPQRLRIHTDPAELRTWTAANLNDYWRRWVVRVRRPGLNRATLLGRRFIAGGVLGAPRLHYTIGTGEVTTKEAAGRYALETFDLRWHPLIEDALAYWRGAGPAERRDGRRGQRRRDSAEFVGCVIEAGNALAGGPEIL
jgi:Domain of unknown function (DUF4111)